MARVVLRRLRKRHLQDGEQQHADCQRWLCRILAALLALASSELWTPVFHWNCEERSATVLQCYLIEGRQKCPSCFASVHGGRGFRAPV
jgi:hypothetical protein